MIRICAAVLICLTLAGCGHEGATGGAKLTGQVSLDGAPLAKGSVLFMPQAKGGESVQPATAEIVDGKYACPGVPLGKVLVTFVSTRETGKMITDYSEPYAEVVSVIPPKYQSGLPLDVAGDKSGVDFVLTSK
jgi:hypothetical protein